MTILLAAAAVTNLLGYLRAHLDAKVAALAPDFPVEPITGQAVALPPVASWHVAEQQVGTLVPPAVLVIGESTQEANDNPAFFESWHPATIAIIDSDPNTDVLRWRLYLWTLALFATVRDLQQQGGAGISTVTWGAPLIDYQPVFTVADRAHFWQDARLSVRILQGESQ